MFYTPNNDTGIGPIEDLINEGHPPMYQKIQTIVTRSLWINYTSNKE